MQESVLGFPASANASILINQLSASQEPLLSGIIDIKLDDAFDEPIEVPVRLNFKETNGSSDRIEFSIDETSQKLILTNKSPFDFFIKRLALTSFDKVTLMEVNQVIPKAQDISLLLAENKTNLDLFIDAELNLDNIHLGNNIFKYLQLQVVQVDLVEYPLTIDGSDIDFTSTVDKIDVQIVMTEMDSNTNLKMILSKQLIVSTKTIRTPFSLTITGLNASIFFKIQLADKSVKELTLQNEFVSNPVFHIRSSDVLK
jgi:hypothetical protein